MNFTFKSINYLVLFADVFLSVTFFVLHVNNVQIKEFIGQLRIKVQQYFKTNVQST